MTTPTALDPDWIRPVPRPLPIRVVPAHRETLDSYLARLASANRLDHAALRAHIAGDSRRATPLPLPRLSTVSGQPSEVLLRAIWDLESAPRSSPPAASSAGSARLECRQCAASRGRPKAATVHAEHHQAVCQKHQRWLGDAHTPSRGLQPDLSRHPQILRANLTHRRLVRRHGLGQATDAYRDAAKVSQRWHEYRDHDHELDALLTVFHGPGWNLTSTDPTIQAARYPQIVALTRLLASPYWRAKAEQDDPAPFVAEVQRTVAPGYIWTLASSYRRFDPLVQALGRPVQRQPPTTEWFT